ncbi:MAG: HNH endonuclease [Candidatus Accumulibacter similis]|nr:MAG: HNH endonuclease [Candidatus Accumulibacter similis]
MSALQTGRETSISQVKSTESEPQPLATPLSVPVPVPVAAAVPGGAAASPPSLKKNETETEFILKIKKARKKAPPPAEISGQPPSGDIVTAFNVPLLNVEKPDGSRSPDVSAVAVTRFKRVASVKTWVLENARGVCECCKRQAPFFSLDGLPYLEVHHVKPLREGGSDTVSNAVSLCPNCHRELHFGAKKSELVIHLYKTVSRLIGE